MKKKLLTVLNLFAFIVVFGQTGIGTHTPEGALDITSPNKDWGLVLPCVDQAENTTNPTGKNVKKGTVVYDLKENCIRYFNGDKWSGCLATAPIPNPFELNCSEAILNQKITINYPITAGTTVSIPYSNRGKPFDYDGSTIQSEGVTGLQAVLSSGTIEKGAGNLMFSISGTPPVSGEAKFSFSIAGVDCEFVVTAKDYTDIEVPIANLVCDPKDQLGVGTLRGRHIINGKEVSVGYNGSNISALGNESSTSCGRVVIRGSFYLGSLNKPGILVISFSRPVTNVGITFTSGKAGDVFTFTVNNKQPIQLNSIDFCQGNFDITDNKINIIGDKGNAGGNITVGGKWFTQLKLEYNGVGSGSVFGFCLNNSDAL